MKYYKKRNKQKNKIFLIIIIIIIFLVFSLFVYLFNERIFPSVLNISQVKVKAKCTEIINETTLELMKEEFNYNEIITIEKNSENEINLIRANTNKLNYLTSKLSIECNEKLQEIGEVGIEVPLGWLSSNSTFYQIGPNINVDIEPIGSVDVTYDSVFESAGINQTRHKIYLKVNATIKINVPFNNETIKIKCVIPISEAIIVGQIPNTTIGYGENKK